MKSSELTLVKWLCVIILAVSLGTFGLTAYAIRQDALTLQQVVAEATEASIEREGKLSLSLRQHIERETTGLRNSFYDFQQDDIERLRKAAELEVSRQLHGHTRDIFADHSGGK
ncbi:hypothetical protein ABQX22_00510 [Xanthomonas sp. WHRI 1810A]|uniref:hypothetical protein n=1 Tax=Xanthomonas sp. WHRI 1810A TaxID=3161565 RepID=UPI0032E91283